MDDKSVEFPYIYHVFRYGITLSPVRTRSCRHSEIHTEFLDGGETTTWDITRNTPRIPRTSLEFVEMWIVNYPSLDIPRPPVERRVTPGAPHLRTPTDLENRRTATRARLRILLKKIDCIDVVLFAGMFHVLLLTLDLITMRTRPVITYVTFPYGTEKPFTPFVGTFTYERLPLRGNSEISRP